MTKTDKKKLSADSTLVKLLGLVPVFVLQILNASRLLFYKTGILSSYRAGIPVISIGNIVMGGSGKTPFTIRLADDLRANGKNPLIITRGYGRKDENMQIILDGSSAGQYTPEETGDEPYLLKMRLPDTVIICDSDRVRAAKTAEEKYNPDVIILDDGFQHLRLQRDINILMIPPAKSVWKREFFWNSRRADIAIQTGDYVPAYKPKNIDFLHAQRVLGDPLDLTHRNKLDKKKLIKTPVVALAGIADPSAFFTSLRNEGYNVKETLSFPDHYSYSDEDIAWIEEQTKKMKGCKILTTEKDSVKLSKFRLSPELWVAVPLSMKFNRSDKLIEMIFSRLKN